MLLIQQCSHWVIKKEPTIIWPDPGCSIMLPIGDIWNPMMHSGASENAASNRKDMDITELILCLAWENDMWTVYLHLQREPPDRGPKLIGKL